MSKKMLRPSIFGTITTKYTKKSLNKKYWKQHPTFIQAEMILLTA
ncbi:hypothetical protein SLH48_04945 [Cytobacillus sp. IB215316]|nr:hypothetical protein [Cytobacillus sp. IB215316]